ncbi:MAG TPA: DUF1361 domain-containing protein [Flavisolibacter sp.]
MKQLMKTQVLRRLYFSRTEMEQVLILSCLFSICITIIRVLYTSQLMFVWLQWNLFLAVVPYLITRNLGSVSKPVSRWRLLVTAAVWLLFIPNAFYIITDLFHLVERDPVPLWFDLALILSFVWNGIILGILSVRQMEMALEQRFRLPSEWVFILPVMFLNALGVYIGRVLRYNSWDILARPFSLISDIGYLLVHPVRNRDDWSMIICYTLLMTIIYVTVKRIGKTIK